MESNNVNIKGIVSVGSKFHAYYTARALYKYDMLEFIIAGRRHKNKLVPNEKKINIALPQYLGYAIMKMPFIGKYLPYNLVSDILFDKMALSKVKNVDFFIGFNNYVLSQMKKLKKNGTKIILEQRIAHAVTEREICMKEYGRVPHNLSNAMVNRRINEYNLADYILVPSNFVKETMIKNGVEEEKLILIPYGYDPEIFYCTNTRRNRNLKAIFVGSIGFRKGVHYLLEAVKRLKNSGSKMELVLVGGVENTFRHVLKQYQGYYEYKGHVTQNELRQLYNEADVFVFPSLCEGSALVTYEAAACGLPLIVTYNTGSIIEDKKEGLIIEPFSIEAIEEALIYMENNIEDRAQMSSNILEKIKEYTWDKYAERLSSAIKSIIDK